MLLDLHFLRESQRFSQNVESGEQIQILVLSGLATGTSWMCYCKALQGGPCGLPIDKLSILVTIAFSRIVFHEKLTKKAAAGLLCMTVGTLLLAVM